MANKAARKMYTAKEVKQLTEAIGFIFTGEHTGDHKIYIHPVLGFKTTVQENDQISLNDVINRVKLAYLTHICCGKSFDKKALNEIERINGSFKRLIVTILKECETVPEKAFSDEQIKTLGIDRAPNNNIGAVKWILERRAEIIARNPEIQVKLPPIPKEWGKFIEEEKGAEEPISKNAQRGKPVYDWRAVREFYKKYVKHPSDASEGNGETPTTPTDGNKADSNNVPDGSGNMGNDDEDSWSPN